jgi:nitrilase
MNDAPVNDPKVAAIQMNSGADLAANLAAAGSALGEAAAAGAVLAVLPENFAYMGARDTDKLAHAEEAGHGPIQDFLCAAAQRLGLWIVAGTLPVKAPEAGKVFAACLVLDARGAVVTRYDKIHLFDVDVGQERYRESATIAAGAVRPVVVDTPAGRLGLSVCYDLRFPELYRELARQGAEILCVPSAFTRRTGEAHWEVLLRARAIENLCHVIAPGQAGIHPGGRATYGNSLIVDPWGEILARRPEGSGAILASLSSARRAELRRTFPVLQHRRMPSY